MRASAGFDVGLTAPDTASRESTVADVMCAAS